MQRTAQTSTRRLGGLAVCLALALSLLGIFIGARGARAAGAPPYPYIVQDLMPGSNENTQGFALNNSGQVTGFAYHDGQYQAYRWTNGTMEYLGDLGCGSRGYGISDSGVVVGESNTSCAEYDRHGFTYDGGPITEAPVTVLRGISANGQVTGWFESRAIRGLPPQKLDDIEPKPLCYRDGQPLGCGMLLGYGINNAGHVVGSSYVGGGNGPFLYTDHMIDLSDPLIGGSGGRANALNNHDQVVGFVDREAFYYGGGQIERLGRLVDHNGFESFAEAQAINDSGVVVGYSKACNICREQATIFRGPHVNGTPVDLNDLIDPASGWYLNFAYGINDSGVIVGSGSLNGVPKAFLLQTNPDTTVPAVTASVSPEANANGWHHGPVHITLTATDDAQGLGIRSISYQASEYGGPIVVPGATAEFDITPEADLTITYSARDLAGNVSATHELRVKIDTRAPNLYTYTNANYPANPGDVITISVYADSPLAATPIVTLDAPCLTPGTTVALTPGEGYTYAGTYLAPTVAATCDVRVIVTGADESGLPAEAYGSNFTIAGPRVEQTITFGPIPDHHYADSPYQLQASATSGSYVYFRASGACELGYYLNYPYLYFNGLGQCSVTASQEGNEFYYPAELTRTLNVGKAIPVINWAPASIAEGTPLDYGQLNASATYGSGYSLSGTFVYTPAEGTILPVGTHTLSVNFTPNDTDHFESPVTATTTLTVVSSAPPTVTIVLPTGGRPEGSPLTLTATTNLTGSVEFAWTVTRNGDSYAQGYGSEFTFTPDDNGTYRATVVATRSSGGGGDDDPPSTLRAEGYAALATNNSATASKNIGVSNVAPTATFAATTPVRAGLPIELSITGATDASSVDNAAGFSYAFDCGTGAGFGEFTTTVTTASCPTTINETRTVKGQVRDKDGGIRTYSRAVRVDGSKPITTARLSPAPNDAGWNKANVTVKLTAKDATGGSGIQQLTYSATGDQPIAETSASGATVSIVITTEGKTTITFYATDNTGNVESPQSVTVNLDKTAPILTVPANITVKATGPDGAMVDFAASATDNIDTNPVASCNAPTGLFSIGTTTVACTAKDQAGNTINKSFKVKVTSAKEQLDALIAAINDLSGPTTAQKNALTKPLKDARTALLSDPVQTQVACDKTSAFIALLGPATGSTLTPAQSAEYLAAANQIKAVIGCGRTPPAQ